MERKKKSQNRKDRKGAKDQGEDISFFYRKTSVNHEHFPIPFGQMHNKQTFFVINQEVLHSKNKMCCHKEALFLNYQQANDQKKKYKYKFKDESHDLRGWENTLRREEIITLEPKM